MRNRMLWAATFGVAAAVAPALGDAVLPPEGSALNFIHVRFDWPDEMPADTYDLQVVVDDGSPDPFASAVPVVDAGTTLAASTMEITSGLAWDTDYAWRVRHVAGGSPGAWSATRRFSTVPLPSEIPTPVITTGPGTPEPGITLTNIRSINGLFSGSYGVAFDATGAVVWFHHSPPGLDDLRLLPNGRMLYNGGGQGHEVALTGQHAWYSPDDNSLPVHHEISPMPNGNYLALLTIQQEVIHMGSPVTWVGDRIVEFDKDTNEILWDWNTFDAYDTGDFDPEVGGDWTHANAAIYNPADNSVYISVRHLSRITRIDYDTYDIVYNMGDETLPSGDADFGDNLFSFQHAPELLPNGNMMVYDNGNRRDHIVQTNETGVSKAIELAFTGDPPTDATIVWEWTLPEYTPFVGDADRLPGGNTLVCAGAAGDIYEVAANGDVVWSAEMPGAFLDYLLYRAERVPSLNPDTAPSDTDGDGIADWIDVCPNQANPDQADCDGDGFGDVCAIQLGLVADADSDGLPDPCDPSICTGDSDNNGTVDVGDLVNVILDWGTDGSAHGGDVNNDGIVDVSDLVEVILGWGAC